MNYFQTGCFFWGFSFTVFAKYFANDMVAFLTEKSRLVACFLKGSSDLNINVSTYQVLYEFWCETSAKRASE